MERNSPASLKGRIVIGIIVEVTGREILDSRENPSAAHRQR
jgi:hypothetical protein